MPLSWGIRLRIAIGITRALKNLKAANVLLDEDLTPHICDCRLAVLKPLTINSARVEASKADNAWIVREYIQPVSGNQRDDIYAFEVLVLELLTGKYLEPKEENSLVNWASSWLHDNESLDEMEHLKMEMEIPCSNKIKFITACSFSNDSFEDIMKAQVSVIKASATLNIQAFKIKKSVSISFRMTQVHKMAKDHMMMIKDYDWMMISKKLKDHIQVKLKPKSLKFTASDSQDTDQ
ncbi:protein STRUBBELIG-receptor family 2 [Tanacetum coccineum]